MTLLELVAMEVPGAKAVTGATINEHGGQVYEIDHGLASVTVVGGSFLIVENPSSLLRRTVRRGVIADLGFSLDMPTFVPKKTGWLNRLLCLQSRNTVQ